MTLSLDAIVRTLQARYDPAWAESWDAVGLVCGDPVAPVRRVHFAVDATEAVGQEAPDLGAELLVTHHPLFLRGTSSVAATTPKGRLVHRLITGGVALHAIHTNADCASPGVSDALAGALGLRNLRPLAPKTAAARVAAPAAEIQHAGTPSGLGTGRIGTLLQAETLQHFMTRVARALPAAPAGIRVAGDPDRPIRTVAVCGGAGDSLLQAAADAGVDAYVTADLRHHPASDILAAGGPALIDAGHWATEWPWLAQAARLLEADLHVAGLTGDGTTVETSVSTLVTDPWSLHEYGPAPQEGPW